MAEQSKLQLRVITPETILFDQPVRFVVMRSVEGEIGVLPGHEKSVILLDFGDLRIYADEQGTQTDVLAVLGGFATVDETSVTVLSDFAEHPERIDAARMEKNRKRAESRARSESSDSSIQLAEVALRRSLVRGDAGVTSLLEDIDIGLPQTKQAQAEQEEQDG